MTNYVWTAKDADGNTVVKEVEADTAAEAQAILIEDGYSELVLKSDEVMAAAQAGFPKTFTVLGEEVELTAEQKFQHRDDPTVNLWGALIKGVAETKFECAILVLAIAYFAYRNYWTSAALATVALGAWMAFFIGLRLPSIYYRELIKAADWNRWQEILSLVTTLKTIGRFGFIKVPATELTRYRAKAFVGLGDLQKGLIEFQPCEGRPDCPRWLYLLFLAGLYDTGKRHDTAIELSLKAIAEKPTPTAWVDLANRYARYKRDPVKAREAMAEADKSPLPDVAKPFCIRCLGIIAYLEGDLDAAKRDLETAIDLVEHAKSRPFRDGHLSVARAYLACVLAKQGDMSAAQKCFEQAKAYLVATDEDELLAECQTLLKLG